MAENKKTQAMPVRKTAVSVQIVQKQPGSVRTIIPLGIFLLLFVTESLLCIAGLGWHFVHSAKKRCDEIEGTTRNYSITLAEAFADVAELGFREKKYASLSTLMKQKIQANTIDEAFFVLTNGSIVAHSSSKIEDALKGNIANDEFTYNVDLILKPALSNSREIFFTEYNIIGKTIPFDRTMRLALKRYVYPRIDSNGWLASRAVYVKGRPIGTVNFIISKDRIYTYLSDHIRDTTVYLAVALAISLLLSIVITLILTVRYRSIQQTALDDAGKRKSPVVPQAKSPVSRPVNAAEEKKKETEIISIPLAQPVPAAGPPKEPELPGAEKDFITIELMPEGTRTQAPRPVPPPSLEETKVREIKDAIPVKKV